MRCAGVIALICVALSGAVPHAQQPFDRNPPSDLNRRGDGVTRVQIWVDAVQSHRAGMPDEATRRIASWTSEQLEEITIELASLLKLMAEPRGNVFSVWVEDGRKSGNRRVVYSGSELDRLRRMARAAGGRDANAPPSPGDEARIAAAQNRVVKRGAAVHTTIALNRPEQIETRAANPFTTKSDGIVQFTDGQQLGVDNRANHWRFARRLLDLVTPHPSRDSDVRDWYRASCAALLARTQLHADHFDQAVRLFPDDPQLLLFAGSFHESLSAASVQAFIRSAVPPRGVVLRVGSTRTELGRAESFYRRALTIDPAADEARVRLGRVLSRQERSADALGELRRVNPSASPILQYYRALFAGEAAEALGRPDDARAAYERAAELYPLAQAPPLALSQLAMRAGDTTRASNMITNVLSASPERMLEDDPFWTYYGAAGRDADLLLARAYQMLSAAAEP
jgi:tetratricopeptide (TPR) repeat protein